MTITPAELAEVETFEDAVTLAKRKHGEIVELAELNGHGPSESVQLPARGRTSAERLAHDLAAFIQRYVWHPSNAHPIVLALWVMHVWTFAAWSHTPRLYFRGDIESGKSRSLSVLCALTPDAADGKITLPTAPSLYRLIESTRDQKHPPTLCLDEIVRRMMDGAQIRTYDPNARELAQFLLAGFERDGTVPRVANDGTVTRHRTFTPTALAGDGQLDPALTSRTITISMHRTSIEIRFPTPDANADAAKLRNRLARWASGDRVAALADASPEFPAVLAQHPRARDVWRPLLAIADTISPEWDDQARQAARELSEVELVELAEVELSEVERFDAAIRHAIERGYLHPHAYNRRPGKGSTAWLARFEHEGRVELRMSAKDWTTFYEQVCKANRGETFGSPVQVKRAYRDANRLRVSGRNLTATLSVWKGEPQTACVALDMTRIFNGHTEGNES